MPLSHAVLSEKDAFMVLRRNKIEFRSYAKFSSRPVQEHCPALNDRKSSYKFFDFTKNFAFSASMDSAISNPGT